MLTVTEKDTPLLLELRQEYPTQRKVSRSDQSATIQLNASPTDLLKYL